MQKNVNKIKNKRIKFPGLTLSVKLNINLPQVFSQKT